MERTHIYKVPESEIDAKPHIYLRYLNRYGKVVFIFSPENYEKLGPLWKAVKSMYSVERSSLEDHVSELFEEWGFSKDKMMFGMATFFIVAMQRRVKISAFETEAGNIELTFSKSL